MALRPGRDEALSRLFETHYADMVRLAFYLTGSWAVAEELAQEAFVRLWRGWGRLRDQHAALSYLRRTVVNLSRSTVRRRLLELRHQRTIGEEGHDVDPVARLDIARALAALPARKRACVVLRHLVEVPGGAFGIVVAAGTVWVTQLDPSQPGSGPGVVARIDAHTGRLLAPVHVPSTPITIRYGLDAIWVTSSSHPPPNPALGGVSRIDPRSGTITQPLGSVDNVMAVGAGALWGTFANSGEDSGVQRVDPATGRVVATITIPYGVLMAFGLGTLWIAQDAASVASGGGEPAPPVKPGKLYRIDPASNRALGQPVPLPGIAPTALAVGEGAVWVGELDGKTLTRFNLVR